MDVNIFREYDIRGIYPKTINEEIAEEIGKSLAQKFKKGRIILARDARIGSPSLLEHVTKGLKSVSPHIRFLNIGLSSTPMFYYFVCKEKTEGGIMITASHNPKEWNGMKVVGKIGHPITGKEILELIHETK